MSKVIDYKFEKVVKQTEGQTKKHFTQFTSIEERILRMAVNAVSHQFLKIRDHAKQHLECLDREMVIEVMNDFQIIEFNVVEKCHQIQKRVLLRSNKTLLISENGVTKKANVCMVLNLPTCEVITAYVNYTGDQHKSINMGRYNANMDILKYAKM